MTRRASVAPAAVALALLAGACGLGNRQAQADRIGHAGEVLLTAPSVQATLHAYVKVIIPANKVINPGPPRIAPENVTGIGVVINPAAHTAAVGTNSKLNTDAIVFAGDTIYQRITHKTQGVTGRADVAIVPSNFNALAAAYTTQLVVVAAPSAAGNPPTVVDIPGVSVPTTTTTSTTAAPSILRRSVQIVREWAAFDYAAIPNRDKTKHAGSLAINPLDLLRLTQGVLAGSVKQGPTINGATTYTANVSRDRAERHLTDKQRKVLTKEFHANAITRTVFPARFVLDAQGRLVHMELKLRQQLTSTDRADLTVAFDFTPLPTSVKIPPPGRRGTVTTRTLGELVTTVTQ